MTEPQTRRRFQFSLRTLLVVTGGLGLLFGWWGNEKRWETREAKAKVEIRKLGGKIFPAEIGLVYFSVEGVWLSGTSITDGDLEHVGQLRHPYNVDLSNTRITDAGLVHLKGLSSLKHLELANTRVTAEGVKQLRKALPGCEIRN